MGGMSSSLRDLLPFLSGLRMSIVVVMVAAVHLWLVHICSCHHRHVMQRVVAMKLVITNVGVFVTQAVSPESNGTLFSRAS